MFNFLPLAGFSRVSSVLLSTELNRSGFPLKTESNLALRYTPGISAMQS